MCVCRGRWKATDKCSLWVCNFGNIFSIRIKIGLQLISRTFSAFLLFPLCITLVRIFKGEGGVEEMVGSVGGILMIDVPFPMLQIIFFEEFRSFYCVFRKQPLFRRKAQFSRRLSLLWKWWAEAKWDVNSSIPHTHTQTHSNPHVFIAPRSAGNVTIHWIASVQKLLQTTNSNWFYKKIKIRSDRRANAFKVKSLPVSVCVCAYRLNRLALGSFCCRKQNEGTTEKCVLITTNFIRC